MRNGLGVGGTSGGDHWSANVPGEGLMRSEFPDQKTWMHNAGRPIVIEPKWIRAKTARRTSWQVKKTKRAELRETLLCRMAICRSDGPATHPTNPVISPNPPLCRQPMCSSRTIDTGHTWLLRDSSSTPTRQFPCGALTAIRTSPPPYCTSLGVWRGSQSGR